MNYVDYFRFNYLNTLGRGRLDLFMRFARINGVEATPSVNIQEG